MKRIISLALIYVFAITQLCFAMGLQVDPDQINLTNVPLGKKVAVSELAGEPLKLRITNRSGSAYSYEINILHTAQSAYPLPDGFRDIPDTAWVMPQEKEVRVEANQTKEVEFYINIPNKMAYADKKYQAVIEVINKKNNPQDIFILAVQVRIYLLTEKKQGGWIWRWQEWIKKNIW